MTCFVVAPFAREVDAARSACRGPVRHRGPRRPEVDDRGWRRAVDVDGIGGVAGGSVKLDGELRRRGGEGVPRASAKTPAEAVRAAAATAITNFEAWYLREGAPWIGGVQVPAGAGAGTGCCGQAVARVRQRVVMATAAPIASRPPAIENAIAVQSIPAPVWLGVEWVTVVIGRGWAGQVGGPAGRGPAGLSLTACPNPPWCG